MNFDQIYSDILARLLPKTRGAIRQEELRTLVEYVQAFDGSRHASDKRAQGLCELLAYERKLHEDQLTQLQALEDREKSLQSGLFDLAKQLHPRDLEEDADATFHVKIPPHLRRWLLETAHDRLIEEGETRLKEGRELSRVERVVQQEMLRFINRQVTPRMCTEVEVSVRDTLQRLYGRSLPSSFRVDAEVDPAHPNSVHVRVDSGLGDVANTRFMREFNKIIEAKL